MAISYYLLKNDAGDVLGVAIKPRPVSYPAEEKYTLTETTKANFSKAFKRLTS